MDELLHGEVEAVADALRETVEMWSLDIMGSQWLNDDPITDIAQSVIQAADLLEELLHRLSACQYTLHKHHARNLRV